MQFVEIVAVFKSLISSRPGDGLLINDLERDFEKVIGDRLPFGDFGYSSVVDLIKRGMKDDFLVVGDDRNARVEIVNADKLKHIAAYTANVEKLA